MSTSTHTQDQRHFVRVPFAADVRLQAGGKTLGVQLVDIALKGALVSSDAATGLKLQDGCKLFLTLSKEAGEGLSLAGKIVHLEPPLVGIECLEIDVQSLGRLRRLIELNSGGQVDKELAQLFGAR